jgi:hypothetical protein
MFFLVCEARIRRQLNQRSGKSQYEKAGCGQSVLIAAESVCEIFVRRGQFILSDETVVRGAVRVVAEFYSASGSIPNCRSFAARRSARSRSAAAI